MTSDPNHPTPGYPLATAPVESAHRGYPPPPPPPAPPRPRSRFRSWFFYTVLMSSLFANFAMYVSYQEYFSEVEGPSEKFHSGERIAPDKLAIIRVAGTIMPPFTRRVIQAIEKARDDESVKGVVLAVNSPGGLVTDSHQIYHQLKKLSEKKPIVVTMGSMAASGGYYIAMGAGEKARIFAEPTTWTGSIGVIIPHYEITGLAEKIGVRAAPLKTGEFKDALSPFRELSEREKALWDNILNQSFDQFLEVIDDNRGNLNKEQIRNLATGQIYTAKDAKANGLVDEIGFEEDAINALKNSTGLTTVRVVTYEHPLSLVDALMGSSKAQDPTTSWQTLVESTIPRAMYLCSWGQVFPAPKF